jgi:DNA-binding FadR family transcriptional regulator
MSTTTGERPDRGGKRGEVRDGQGAATGDERHESGRNGPQERGRAGEEVREEERSRGVMHPVWIGPPRERTQPHRPQITEHQTRWRLRLPPARARTALVVATRRLGPAVLGAKGAPTRWQLFWLPGTLYEVDQGLHHTAFDFELPSKRDTFDFTAHVAVEWRVADPLAVVRDNVLDVRDALRQVLLRGLSDVTREFHVVEIIAAERTIAHRLVSNDPGAPYGLQTRIDIRLAADPDAARYAASRREVEQQTEIEELKHSQRRMKESYEKEVIQTRMALYKNIVDSGNVDQCALLLARNPGDVNSIFQLLREERERERRQVTEFITSLLDSGAIDRWDVDDHVRTALEWLKVSTERTVQTGDAHIPQHRRAPAPGAGAVVVAVVPDAVDLVSSVTRNGTSRAHKD